MSSNYPPGVSGMEYEISGPSREWEQDRVCPLCGTEGIFLHQEHPIRGRWAFCNNPECLAYDDGFDLGSPFEEVEFCGCTNEELEAGRTCGQASCPNRQVLGE